MNEYIYICIKGEEMLTYVYMAVVTITAMGLKFWREDLFEFVVEKYETKFCIGSLRRWTRRESQSKCLKSFVCVEEGLKGPRKSSTMKLGTQGFTLLEGQRHKIILFLVNTFTFDLIFLLCYVFRTQIKDMIIIFFI